jgi:hypothetical protein
MHYVSANKRLPSGETQLGYSQRNGHPHNPQQLFIAEQLIMIKARRTFGTILFWYTVKAFQITAIRQR